MFTSLERRLEMLYLNWTHRRSKTHLLLELMNISLRNEDTVQNKRSLSVGGPL